MNPSDKSWQSRLNRPPDEITINFVESLTIDQRLYKYDIAGSIAHAQMLCEQKLITRTELTQIKNGLTEIAEKIQQGKFRFDKNHEDIHMVLEAALIKLIGEPGRKLHTGRSRNDQVALDMRLWMRDEIEIADERIRLLQDALLTKAASQQGRQVICGYTHLQRAQPILTGSYLLAYVEQFQRDRSRLTDCRNRLNVCPLGAGALAGTSLPLNRQRTAELLGFTEITRNSLDAVSDRDFAAEFLFCTAMIGMHLSRLAEDWIIFSSREFDLINLDDAFCTSSSMMPQKRNPDMLELIRGKSGSLYGNLIALLTMLKAQPLTYNRDMQEDKKQVFDAADTIAACLDMAAALVKNTHFNQNNIAQNLDQGYPDATALADYLVQKNIPFRTAHQIVGKLIQQCETTGATLSQLPLDQLQKASDQIESDVFQHLGAENVVARYTTAGAAGPNQLNDQIEFWKRNLKKI